MTTWESIDNVDMENVTVTSDVAFERVTSDEHFEEEKDGWYLQQNTSWLVQEIPNIAFIDIADTMLESKKTLYDRENWVIRVWKEWKSIEAQPQDTMLLSLAYPQTYSSPNHIVPFDNILSSQNFTTCRPDNTYAKIDILETWYYTISYWWILETWTASTFTIWVFGFPDGVYDQYTNGSYPEVMSWWKYMPNVKLNKWDFVCLKIEADWNVVLRKDTYMSVQFQQYIL